MPKPERQSGSGLPRTATVTAPDMSQLLRQNVRRLRLKAGLTQQALAQHCSKYKKQIAQIEDGTAEVNLSMIFVVAQALGVDPSVLLQDEPPPGA